MSTEMSALPEPSKLLSEARQGSLLPDDELPDAAELATAAIEPGNDGHFSELTGQLNEPGAAKPHLAPLWEQFFTSTGTAGWLDLDGRTARVERRVQEDGASYNVYDDGAKSARVWPLELLPMLVGADEWKGIEKGAIQRARLLNATLADVYGPRKLLDAGLLPASLVFAHPQYLRAMHGIAPLGGVHLHVLALDLARCADGLWWVVGQRTQAPSGMGYMLENRLIVAQQFPEAFRDMSVQRLAGSFQALLDGLMRLAPAGANTRVALLTPGPHNETYFEHAFLARYLGVTLVEGGDLTVRDNRVFLKTLHGLERVHVLLRRVDDDYLDPLELRSDSALGVPGLLQAMRAGEVVVANAPGAGWLESPGLSAFWPGVAKALLGEALILPATNAWWCGEDEAWRRHRGHLDDFVVSSTFPSSDTTQAFAAVVPADLSASERDTLRARILADPAAHTLQARLKPSELPVWQDGRLEPRPAVMRVFAVSDGLGSWRVLPGGLTRVSHRRDGQADPWLSMQSGSASADTWVLTKGAVDATTLLPQPLQAADLSQVRWTVTSRSAENLFWLGRYTERAENSVRLARLTLESLASFVRGGTSIEVLQVLDALARQYGLVGADVPPAAQGLRVFERALMHALIDTVDANSVAYNLQALQGCAQALRDRLSPEHWTLIQDVGELCRQGLSSVLKPGAVTALSDVIGVLSSIDTHLAAITGAQTDRMTRDDGWRLLSVGRQIERLDFLSSALIQGFECGLQQHDDGFALLLGLFDSTITYRAQFQGRREVPPLLHLLVHDTDNPRSLAWVARTMRERFMKLSRRQSAWADEAVIPLPHPEDWPLELISAPGDQDKYPTLIALLKESSAQAQALSTQISRRLFSHVGSLDRMVWQ
jgi:uncharacterized circularly permuted ATP-grasp superfamily protein/uncharacterized alpha-E superfamily protein